MTYSTLISTADLAAHLDAGWVVLDCRYDLANSGWGHEQYAAAHIPHAAFVSLSHDLAGPPNGRNGRHPLPTVDAMTATFARLGIDRGRQVVAYDQDAGMYASRLWWMLRYLGHDAVAVMDGGWAKWTRESRPTATGDESHAPASFQAQPRETLRLGVDEVMALTTNRAQLLVDARAPERFEGRSEPLDRVAGHIPGAVNHFFKSNLADDGTMLPVGALQAHFAGLLQGRTADQVVMYCGSGVTACQNLLAMTHAGLTGARLYPGSWSEWSSDPARPVETGPPRR